MVGQNNSLGLTTEDFWYRQRVIDTIQNLYSQRNSNEHELPPLFLPNVISNNGIELFKASIFLFSSWENALQEAGIPLSEYHKIKKLHHEFWTPENIVAQIRILYEHNFDLSSGFIKFVYPDLYGSTINKLNFGSWWKALSEAEVDYRKLRSNSLRFWTMNRILTAILIYDQTYGNVQPEFIRKYNPSLYFGSHRYFKTWSEAMERAGVSQIRNLGKVLLEPFRNYLLNQYLQKVLDIDGIEFKMDENKNRHPIIKHFDISEYQEFEYNNLVISRKEGETYLTTNFFSWGFDVELRIFEILKIYHDIELYHSVGEPRKWVDQHVKFINVMDFYSELECLGRDDMISELSHIARGGIPKKFQKQYEVIMKPIKEILKKHKKA